jgi:Fur family ferric uptake transcriptional regulator
LDGAAGFQSAHEIHAVLRLHDAGVSISTVYRVLRVMVEAADLDVLVTSSDEKRYRRCSAPVGHHHLICAHCGAVVELDDPTIGGWAETLRRDHGFVRLDAAGLDLMGTVRSAPDTPAATCSST